MKTDLFDYPLPEWLIAQVPAERRDASRLLVVHRAERRIEHRRFRDLGSYLRAGDTLFRNNAAVIPARLHATRPTGGAVECLLLRPANGGRGARKAEGGTPDAGGGPGAERGRPEERGAHAHGEKRRAEGGPPEAGGALRPPSTASVQHPAFRDPPLSGIPRSALRAPPDSAGEPPAEAWWCLLRPGKKLPVGATFGRAGEFTATVQEKTDDGLARVAFHTPGSDILAVANRLGDMPLPPYIHQRIDADARRVDRERYQTVYADRARQVAAAAPTAGLHFTPELLAGLAAAGVRFADLTLHVGLGTFRPITTEHVEDHPIHREVYEIPPATQQALVRPTGRRVAVGTTAVRSIEDHLANRGGDDAHHQDRACVAEASIFIYPPREFRGVDALITNFHQPRSTLLCLVAAFLAPGSTEGIAWLKDIYAEAVVREYRFFSYGDAMLIL